jgi:hypothetical protein
MIPCAFMDDVTARQLPGRNPHLPFGLIRWVGFFADGVKENFD